MRYLLMISADESQVDEVVGEDGVRAFTAWMDDLVERGVILAHEGLRPSRTATTVRVRDNEVLLTDGPYLEVRDQIGGFAIVDVPTLEEAVRIAAAHPACGVGQVEIRPLREP
ncbi:transcription initiation protein [Actinophytocola xinjiangensis]|uniref:Transcription initiation protein n=1 Tax=Actinophytocola xinjiangensis TaxID=485602 RepID=A0A7Z0WNP2_9PSEU|nr:YciI family protein [Actinophytocola xinjiangensis]OLF11782.1 transcription initiation protein [Actinophytocola xinjiangensis]